MVLAPELYISTVDLSKAISVSLELIATGVAVTASV